MKKLFILLSVAIVALSAASCRGPQGPKGDPGMNGQNGLVNFKVIDLDIKQNEWGYTDPNNELINNYFYADFDLSDVISKDIYDNGLIKVYREYNTGTNKARQIELPYTHYVEEVVDEANLERYFYSEHVDYEFGIDGQLSIYYTLSDFYYDIDEQFIPEGMHFRVVVMW